MRGKREQIRTAAPRRRMGNTDLLGFLLVLLLAAGLAGGFVGGRVFKNLSMTWLRRGFALLILYGGVKALL